MFFFLFLSFDNPIKLSGAPYRSTHEFKQIYVDNKAKVEIFDKRILLLAKQSAAGIEKLYGKRYDFASVKHVIRDAMILQRLDLPASMKPKVTHQQAVHFKRVLNAAMGFNIPLLVQLMEVNAPLVYTNDMCATGLDHYQAQASGGNSKPMNSNRLETMRMNALTRRQGSHEAEDDKTIRKKNLSVMFRALKVQHKIYGHAMGNVREAFYKRDVDEMGTLSHADFKLASYDLGLGLTEFQLDQFINAVDQNDQGVVEYDAVLKPLHMELVDFREADVPKKSTIGKMRRQERVKLLKTNADMFNSL